MKFIAALNSLNQPWVAILVIIIGMVFDIVCQHYNVSNDAATGVIGAGVGLLTSQGLHSAAAQQTGPSSVTITAAPVVSQNPSTPAEPAKEK